MCHHQMKNFDSVRYGSIESQRIIDDSSETVDKKCTALEAASNQIAVVTGAGMLSLPFAAASMGWSVIILLGVLTGAFCYSYTLLVYVIDEVALHTDVLVDYVYLGKEAFGSGGDQFVLLILMCELFLALVSFFINIGLNANIIFPTLDISTAIVLSGLGALVTSYLNMKLLSRITALGNGMTVLTLIALILSGFFLPIDTDSNSSSHYKWFDIHGLPISLGIMAYCFGGHGALYV